MDFSRVFRSSTTIHTIKEVIENYHGGNIQKLTLCKDTYTETNELRNDRITLKECLGISKNYYRFSMELHAITKKYELLRIDTNY